MPKIALVHDYINEFGGAERVLEVLAEMYPDAPIYTAFVNTKGTAYPRFKAKHIIQSWFHLLPYASRLASPLRFLTPFIWGSFDLSGYDVVISSASWYVTKGFGGERPVEICYCHTPPRWLYGYNTSVNFQKYPLVRLYAKIVGYFLRKYDYAQAQKVNVFVTNSKEVQGRIKKFYHRDSTIVYPPVSLPTTNYKLPATKKDYYFIVSRLVGGKGLELAIEAAKQAGFRLKIAGSSSGYYEVPKTSHVEFLGQVSDEELVKLYSGAKAFFALSKDEDFGITPVEAMSCGTPVVAYNGGGYKETVLQGRTGILFDDYSVEGLVEAVKKFEQTKISAENCIQQAKKFSRSEFERKMREIVNKSLS